MPAHKFSTETLAQKLKPVASRNYDFKISIKMICNWTFSASSAQQNSKKNEKIGDFPLSESSYIKSNNIRRIQQENPLQGKRYRLTD